MIARDQVIEWCNEHGMLATERSLLLNESVEFFIALEIPAASEGQLLLARDLVLVSDTASQRSLFWITEWGVWTDPPASLGQMVMNAIRLLGTGERVTLEAASATLLSPNEADSLQLMIFNSLAFRWDAWLAPETRRCTFQISHDGLIWIESADWDTHNGILAQLRRWKPKVRERRDAAVS